jgi:hypothetical protein
MSGDSASGAAGAPATDERALRRRLSRLHQLLAQTTDPAAATAISDEIADVESQLKARQAGP